MKKYIPTTTPKRFLKVETYYSLGGYSYWTSKQENRGYYLSVYPVEKGNGLESYIAFSGIKRCIHPVSRKSAKAEAIAETIAASAEKNLIAYVCEKNGLTVAD